MKLIIAVFLLIVFQFETNAIEMSFPKKAQIISMEDANYLTPENAYYSIISCLLSENMDWCDNSITKSTLEKDLMAFEKANIDRAKIFELQKNIKESYIIDKFQFKNSTVLLIEDHTHHGTITIMPLTFVKEDGLWKLTNEYAADEELNSYLYYIPPLFDGKGGRPMDVNTFLGYKNPNQAQTQLDLGESSYTVHVYYGRTIDPSTFTAELNRQDVSAWFSPQPLSNEKVELPLQKGRNTLVLSVEGARSDGKRARDTDRLVFIMP